jgi:tRNA A37 threonylcarbamoyladenosine dehydratase
MSETVFDHTASADATASNDMRFSGVEALYGPEDFAKITGSSVCIVGLGGVGSWCAEACARSGIGNITLVDLDDVCVTNINRQVQALSSTVGFSKCRSLGERIRDINPNCNLRLIEQFVTERSLSEVFSHRYDVVIDAIDSAKYKAALIAECVSRGTKIVTVGSGGDRIDPSRIVVADLAKTEYDALLQIVRKRLRQKHGFPRGQRRLFGVPAVYVPLQRGPRKCCINGRYNGAASPRKTCNDGLGSVVFMTGTMGFVAVGEALRIITKR